VIETLQDPQDAAKRIMALRVDRGTLYQALALVSALNTIIVSLGALSGPSTGQVPALFMQPFALFVVLAGGVIVSGHLIYWSGRMIGATGSLADTLALLVWLQALRFVGQVLVLISGLIFPALALLLAFCIVIIGVWLLLHFVRAGMRLKSLWQSAGLLLMTLIGLLFGFSVLVSLIGAANLGVVPNV
jgi:hypothetical protein